MMHIDKLREGQRIVGSDGGEVGTLAGLSGQLLRLGRSDAARESVNPLLDVAMIASVEGDEVRLVISAAEAKQRWSGEA